MNENKKFDQIVILPSDSNVKLFRNNTTAKFRIKLPETLNFQNETEVGLLEIVFPKTIRNFMEQSTIKIIAKSENEYIKLNKYTFEKGIFNKSNLEKIIEERLINFDETKSKKAIEQYYSTKFKFVDIQFTEFSRPTFTSNSFSDKYQVKCGSVSFIHDNLKYDHKIYVIFDKYLNKVLGFENQILSDLKTADNLLDILGENHILYIYSDIVSPTIVGQSKVQILQIITISYILEEKNNLSVLNRYTFENPIYFPIIKNNFDIIEIEIRNDIGNLVQFESGKTLLIIHFREKINKS